MITADSYEITAFWQDACQGKGIDPATPYHARSFADPRHTPKVDEIGNLARMGQKRGTAHLALDFEHNNVPTRAVGDYWLVLGSAGDPLCLVRVSAIDTWAFMDVSAEFAASEGEGDMSLESWRAGHKRYFTKQLESWGMEWRDDVATVCESFRLIYAG